MYGTTWLNEVDVSFSPRVSQLQQTTSVPSLRPSHFSQLTSSEVMEEFSFTEFSSQGKSSDSAAVHVVFIEFSIQ